MSYEPLVTARCTGLCCTAFPLSVGLDMPANWVQWMLRLGVGRPAWALGPAEVTFGVWGMELTIETRWRMINWEDREYIHDMIIPIEGPWPEDSPSQNYFTCKHFDGADCTAYDARPKLCQRHGVTSACDYRGKGCTIETEGLRGMTKEECDALDDKVREIDVQLEDLRERARRKQLPPEAEGALAQVDEALGYVRG